MTDPIASLLGDLDVPAPATSPAPSDPLAASIADAAAMVGRSGTLDDEDLGGYRPRQVGPTTDVALLRRARQGVGGRRMHVLMESMPGAGKTSCMRAAFGATLNSDGVDGGFVTFAANGDSEVSHLLGRYVPDGGDFVWVDGPLTVAMRRGLPLLFDDLTAAPVEVQAVLLAVMDDRAMVQLSDHAGEWVVAEPNFFVCGAFNPEVGALQPAVASRFALRLTFTTDYALARDLGVPADLVALAEELDRQRREEGLGWSPQMRELLAARDVATAFGSDLAASSLVGSAPEHVRDDVLATARAMLSPTLAVATTGGAA